jgi:N-carbamoylputrescine amidase
VVYSIQEICDEAHVPQPIIVSESGRAITAHHSVLIVEALGAYRKDQGQYISMPSPEDSAVVHELFEVQTRVRPLPITAGTSPTLSCLRPTTMRERNARGADTLTLLNKDPTFMATRRTVQVGLVQMRCDEDPDANLAKALAMMRAAAGQGAQIICLPELFHSRYFCQTEDYRHFALAERLSGPSTEAFGTLATALDVTVIVSVFERRTAGLYHNTAVVIEGKRGLLGAYRKMHIPDDPRYFEKFYFTPGDLSFKAFATAHGTLGVLVCWNQWYPEAARLTALRGAEVLFYPTAIGWHPEEKAAWGKEQHEAWEISQRAHAIASGLFQESFAPYFDTVDGSPIFHFAWFN